MRTRLVFLFVALALASGAVLAWLLFLRGESPDEADTAPVAQPAVPADASTPAAAQPLPPALPEPARLIPQEHPGFDDLPSNVLTALAIQDQTWYVGTDGGLAISRDGGKTFAIRTTRLGGLAANQITALHVSGREVIAGTRKGLSISRDGGETFTTPALKAAEDAKGAKGAEDLAIRSIVRAGDRIHVLTGKALWLSSDGGKTFASRRFSEIPDDETLNALHVEGEQIYIATSVGLLSSRDGAASFELLRGALYQVDKSGGEVCGDESCEEEYPILGESTDGYKVVDGTLMASTGEAVEDAELSMRALELHDVRVADGTLYLGIDYGLLSSENGKDFSFDRLDDLASSSDSIGVSQIEIAGEQRAFLDQYGRVYFESTEADGPFSLALETSSWTKARLALVGKTLYIATGTGLLVTTGEHAPPVPRTTRKGLPANRVLRVVARPDMLIALTSNGDDSFVSISRDRGRSFASLSEALHRRGNKPIDVFADDRLILVTTFGGLFISEDGGKTFRTVSTLAGLGYNVIETVAVDRDTIFAATRGGLSISRDRGRSFVNRTKADGLASDWLTDVAVTGSDIYVATDVGLSISRDGGQRFETLLPCPPDTARCKDKKTARQVNAIRALEASAAAVYITTGSGELYLARAGAQALERAAAHAGGSLPESVLWTVQAGEVLWIGTRDGVYVSRDGAKTVHRDEQLRDIGGEQANHITVLDGTAYVATQGGLHALPYSLAPGPSD